MTTNDLTDTKVRLAKWVVDFLTLDEGILNLVVNAASDLGIYDTLLDQEYEGALFFDHVHDEVLDMLADKTLLDFNNRLSIAKARVRVLEDALTIATAYVAEAYDIAPPGDDDNILHDLTQCQRALGKQTEE